MTQFLLRLGLLALVALVAWLIVWGGRRYVEARRRLALAAAPAALAPTGSHATDTASVRILAFSSDDCVQCHRMQAPALDRVRAARGELVAVEEIDAPSSPDLTSRYHVLTVPTTVVLDGSGRASAVNYGFANTQRLIEQVDAALAKSSATAAEAGTAAR